MAEGPPNKFEKRDAKETNKERVIALAVELSESHETFPFSGIDPEAYAKIKADEEESPGYATPIDELLERFKSEGMKVVLGKHPESGNVFILPSQSSDIENDSLFPRHLQMSEDLDNRVKELILLGRN